MTDRDNTTVARVLNFQRFSLHDGPGIRTTVFFKGCPLTCPWCHNPESQAAAPELLHRPHRCLACGACLQVCPASPPTTGTCRVCGRCARVCPGGARQMAGEELPVDQVVARAGRDRAFFAGSGGGITFSGGEPLAQPEALLACLELTRGEGIHTALDTSGEGSQETLLAAAALADLILYDLKCMDPTRHLTGTGVPLAPILANLHALEGTGRPVRIRLPLIPGWNDDRENLAATAHLVADLATVEGIDLLPYHRSGGHKYDSLKRPEPLARTPRPDPQQIEAAVTTLAAAGVKVTIGG